MAATQNAEAQAADRTPSVPTVTDVDGRLVIEWPDPRSIPRMIEFDSELFQVIINELNDARSDLKSLENVETIGGRLVGFVDIGDGRWFNVDHVRSISTDGDGRTVITPADGKTLVTELPLDDLLDRLGIPSAQAEVEGAPVEQ